MRRVYQIASPGLSILDLFRIVRPFGGVSSCTSTCQFVFMSKVKPVSRPRKAEPQKMELLVSKNVGMTSDLPPMPTRMKISLGMLAFGIIGSISCLFAMFNTEDSASKIEELGMQRVANSLDNVLATLAFPILLFFLILTMFACQRIFLDYRAANDPDRFKRRKADD